VSTTGEVEILELQSGRVSKTMRNLATKSMGMVCAPALKMQLECPCCGQPYDSEKELQDKLNAFF
jgi:hypothetical protein